jgi:hypothetical protein
MRRSFALVMAAWTLAGCTTLDPAGGAGTDPHGPVSRAEAGGPWDIDADAVGRRSDAGSVAEDASGSRVMEAGPDGNDAAIGVPDPAVDAASMAKPDGSMSAMPGADGGMAAQPQGECDPTRACSVGYRCQSEKCVSACAQKVCDPNATCALMSGNPVCTCNAGFVAQGSVDNPTCQADLDCQQLRCDEHASCDVVNGVRNCKCKLGYTGSGMACTPVSCPTLTLEHGSVSAGNRYGDTVTYSCQAGYRPSIQAAAYTRTCGADMTWSGAAIECIAVTCGMPPLVPNAVAAPNVVGSYNATATYTCSSGHSLSGLKTITCQQSGEWSSPPRCVADPVCGNGQKEAGEECDPKVAGTDPWKCDPVTCRPRTTYSPCWSPRSAPSDKDCASGEVCREGYCTKSCSDAAGCPKASVGLAICSQGFCVPANCQFVGDCAPGLVCSTNPFPVSCRGCTSSQACWSAGTGNCVGPNGLSFAEDGTYGRCSR